MRPLVLALVLAACAADPSPPGDTDSDPPADSDRNQAPIAVAEAVEGTSFRVGQTVSLDGSESSDPDGDDLTFAWTLDREPTGSTASVSNATSVAASLYFDVAGAYDVTLTVSDGHLEDRQTLSFDVEHVPVADAGIDQVVEVGTEVTLSGAGSTDEDDHALAYHWSWVTRPPGSQAELLGADDPATAVTVTFVPDVAGTYTLKLEVWDGTLMSRADLVNVAARIVTP